MWRPLLGGLAGHRTGVWGFWVGAVRRLKEPEVGLRWMNERTETDPKHDPLDRRRGVWPRPVLEAYAWEGDLVVDPCRLQDLARWC